MGPDNQLLAEKLATDLNATSEVSDIVAILGKPTRSFGGRNDWTISDQPPVIVQAYFGVMDDKLYKIKLIGLDPLWRLDLEY